MRYGRPAKLFNMGIRNLQELLFTYAGAFEASTDS